VSKKTIPCEALPLVTPASAEESTLSVVPTGAGVTSTSMASLVGEAEGKAVGKADGKVVGVIDGMADAEGDIVGTDVVGVSEGASVGA
jgi:hypothetical protein